MELLQLLAAIETYRDNALAAGDGRGQKRKPITVTRYIRVPWLDACWIVTSHKSKVGYPKINVADEWISLHRLAKIIELSSEIPAGLEASHLCEQINSTLSRQCINPAHIVLEDRSTNIKRSPNLKQPTIHRDRNPDGTYKRKGTGQWNAQFAVAGAMALISASSAGQISRMTTWK
jgi:hypothetical protein